MSTDVTIQFGPLCSRRRQLGPLMLTTTALCMSLSRAVAATYGPSHVEDQAAAVAVPTAMRAVTGDGLTHCMPQPQPIVPVAISGHG